MDLTQEYFNEYIKELRAYLDLRFAATPTNDELAGLATKEDLETAIHQVVVFLSDRVAHKDDLTKLATTADVERRFEEVGLGLSLIQNDLTVVKKNLHELGNRTRDDDDALSRELVKLKDRVATLEKQLKRLKHA